MTVSVWDGKVNVTANVTVAVGEGSAAGPSGPTEDEWATFNADGTCDAKGEFKVGPGYVHERGSPPGTGYLLGRGTWIYEESNGIDGLQVGGPDEEGAYTGCLNPDTLIF